MPFYGYVSRFFLVISSVVLVGASVLSFGEGAFAATNLLTNGDFSAGTSSGWTVVQNGGSGATFSGIYATSYTWNSISQRVDLVAAGYSAAQLDEAPSISFDISTFQRFDHDGYYYLEYKLLAADGSTVLASRLYGSAASPIHLNAGTNWFGTPYVFSGYGAGVRYAYIKIAGQDGSPDWGGQYGPYFDNASITIPDAVNPSVTTLSPADGAVDVALDADLVIAFDEAVTTQSGNITIKRSSDDTTVETIDVEGDQVTGSGTATITVNPDGALTDETEYYVVIDSTAFDDLSGNGFAGISDATTWNFTTGDFSAPTIRTFSPANGATEVAPDTDLTITFDESVSIGSGNIVVYDANGNVFESFDVQTDVAGNGTDVLTIDPESGFADGTTYYVLIPSSAVEDADGNAFAGISGDTVWRFSTAATVVAASEEDDARQADIVSWKAKLYRDVGSARCTTKVRLEITGHDFDKNAEVRVGGKKPFATDRKSSKKIVAKFCYDTFFKNKTNIKKSVTVRNPDSETEKAGRKLDVRSIKRFFREDELSMQTFEGLKNIQSALSFFGYLDARYVTGVYGPITTAAVMKFQEDNGIDATGWVGPLTRTRLSGF